MVTYVGIDNIASIGTGAWTESKGMDGARQMKGPRVGTPR